MALVVGHSIPHPLPQVSVFFRWMRYILDVTLKHRPYVILNMDETSLAAVRHGGAGMVSGSLRAARRRVQRPTDPRDRFGHKVTHLGCVTDNPHLQPLLPQVVLPKYTQNAVPPADMRERLSATGFPLEFWHGTAGIASVGVLQAWATRVRSIVHSWNDDAFILLVVDCASCHLSLDFLRHLSRLGILTLLVPAKLTWLLQVLDVSVFGPLKADIRTEEMRIRSRHASGRLLAGDALVAASQSIRRVLVNRDWSDSFDSLGLGLLGDIELSSSVTPYIDHTCSQPALPTAAELAMITGRPAASATTRTMHSLLVRPALDIAQQPPEARPKRGAYSFLPASASAVDSVATRRERDAAGDHDRIRASFLRSQSDATPHLSSYRPARQVHFT